MAQKQKSGKSRSALHKAYYVRYRNAQTREIHKIRRVLKSNGRKEAEKYAASRGTTVLLLEILRKRGLG